MRTARSLLVLLVLAATPALGVELKVRKDIPYADPPNKRQMLDVYSPADAKKLPILVYIHGGGWKAGDKAGVQKKPQAFADEGFVFVSTTYRFVPEVTVKEMTGDCAKAIRWVHDHAKEIGGDPDRIIVMGHSAGAHLAALVCTDDSYLKKEGLSLAILRGCIPVDVSVYDVPKRLADGGSVPADTFTALFGKTAEEQKSHSPAAHVAADKHIPPFLILHVASRPDTKAQSEWFAQKLKAAGVSAKVYAAENKTHGTINSELGLAEDKATQEVFAFLKTALEKSSDSK